MAVCILAESNFDWLTIDMEHTSIDLNDILNNVKLIDNRFILFFMHFGRSVATIECI